VIKLVSQKWKEMTAFKRLVFCLLFFGSFAWLPVKVTPPHSPYNVFIPITCMWVIAFLAVPGKHVPYIARLVALPVVCYFSVEFYEFVVKLLEGERVEGIYGVVNVVKALVEYSTAICVLILGRFPKLLQEVSTP
jgi:hypothetical protein